MRDFVAKKTKAKRPKPEEPPAQPPRRRSPRTEATKTTQPEPERKPEAPPAAPPETVQIRPEPPTPVGGSYPHIIGLRIDASLFRTIHEALVSAHATGDYTFTSMPDLIRAALRAYFDNKLTLRAAPDPGPKKRTTIGLDDELKERYEDLPKRKRGEIIERVLQTFISSGLAWGKG
jgi:hypothetical protein